MSRATAFVSVLACLAAGLSALAQAPAERFRYERVVVSSEGPQRLRVDATLLTGSARFDVTTRGDTAVAENGLRDLRFVDQAGRPVPYLLLQPPAAARAWLPGRILDVAATKKTSGFEVDLGTVAPVDQLRVAGVPAPFLKRLTLEGSGDRQHWTMLVADGTLFDLPDEQVTRDVVDFAPGPYRYLRVTWNDTNSARITTPRTAFARRVAGAAAPKASTVDVPFDRRPSEPGTSRYRIRLPSAGWPIVAVELEAGGGAIHRRAVVTESRLGGEEVAPMPLGSARLVRVTRDGTTASALRVAIAPPAEAELQLTIDDGDNPPLDLEKVSVVLAELPWIYVDAPAGGVRARYGSTTATRPSYDLEALRERIDIAKVTEARWGEVTAAVEVAETIATPVPEVGAALDAGGFRTSRAIDAPSAGLVALPLDAHVLARSRGPSARFADVRVVDTASRQVPYLLERRDEPLSIDVTLVAETSPPASVQGVAGRRPSVYRLTLPHTGLPPATLVVETSARVFERVVIVGVERAPDQSRREPRFEMRAQAMWRHVDDGLAARPLAMRLDPSRDQTLLLVVDEGDNATLPLTKARLLLPSYRLRFYRPGTGALRLVYGQDQLQAPRYDLALLAPRVMGAVATEASAAAPPEAPLTAPTLVAARTFWIVLAIAVAVLLGLIAHLIRSRGADLSP